MKHPLSEVFGFPIDNNSEEAEEHRTKCLCPYNNHVEQCTKNSLTDPLGVCSVYHENKPVITCPVRFTENWIIAEDCAKFFFDDSIIKKGTWATIREVRLKDAHGKSAGNIDYVLASYNDSGEIIDFGSVEVQAVYISGNVTDPFKSYMSDRKSNKSFDWTGEPKYPRPDYLSSSRKRLAPQLMYKGGILKQWNKKQAVVLQDTFLKTLPDLPTVNEKDADVAWFVYSLKKVNGRYLLKLKETLYTEFLDALNTISTPDTGKVGDFMNDLQKKFNKQNS